jgi:TetR/AcrR family transcriptional repressor of mexJK operon
LSTLLPRRRGRQPDPAKRETILAAATAEFLEHGYEASKIEAIATKAGVSKVTVYSHFGTKTALFTAAVESECEKIRGTLLFDEGQAPLKERLAAFGHAMIAFLSRPEMVRFEQRIAAETERHPELGRCFLEAGPMRMKRALADLLERARQRGELVGIPDPLLAAEQFASMVKGMADLERRFTGHVDRAATNRRIDAAVALFLKGYGR